MFVVFQPQRSSHYCLKHEEGATLNSVLRGLYSFQHLQCGFPVEGSGTYVPFWLDVVEVLVFAALLQFLYIHKGNITWRVCQLPAAIPVQPSWTRQRSFEERSTDCQRCRRQVVCVHVCTCLCLCLCILQGLDHVSVYLEEILLTGTTVEEHLQLQEEVLRRLEEVGLRLKKSKCAFMLSSMEYLG